MTPPTSQLRRDLDIVLRAALDSVDAGTLVQRALDDPDLIGPIQRATAVDVVAAGKASGVMLNAFVAATGISIRQAIGIGPVRPKILPADAEFFEAGHPLPNAGSVAGARRALEIAAASTRDDLMIVLLSGGGSALMALPAGEISLADKQSTAATLLQQGADIYELNTVRKHLSAIKGGQLAAAAAGSVLTMAVSDVVGDDLSVIASGPTVHDPSTFASALAVLTRRGGVERFPARVVEHLQAGAEGRIAETPKPGDSRLNRATARVIGLQRGAVVAAAQAAHGGGYHVHIVSEPVTGEARDAAVAHVARIEGILRDSPRPVCVISSGETTVTVQGKGRGGRNQEFALAMAGALARLGTSVAAASVGTDGIDGPTDAAGAIVDSATAGRATQLGMTADHYLTDNDSYTFFERLGDLVRTGPTNTNVGDLQIVLIV